MDPRYMTLKEKAALFAQRERETREYPDDYIGVYNNAIIRAFLRDYNETRDFIPLADTDELECFMCVLSDFIKKYPNEEIIQMCIERKREVGDFYDLDFDREIEYARKVLSKIKEKEAVRNKKEDIK